MLKLALIDFDGTLADTESLHIKSWILAGKELGLEFDKDVVKKFAGKDPITYSKLILKEIGADSKLYKDLLTRKYNIAEQMFIKKEYSLMSYAKEFINNLRKKNIIICIVSNASRKEVDLKLNSSELFYNCSISIDDVDHPKPYPDMYLKGLELNKVSNSEAVVIEDSEPGVLAGVSAGIFTIAVPNKETINQDFSKANYIAKDLKDAYRIISDLYDKD